MPKATNPNPEVPQELRSMVQELVSLHGVSGLSEMLGVSRNVPRQWLLGLRRPTPDHVDRLKAMLVRADNGAGI